MSIEYTKTENNDDLQASIKTSNPVYKVRKIDVQKIKFNNSKRYNSQMINNFNNNLLSKKGSKKVIVMKIIKDDQTILNKANKNLNYSNFNKIQDSFEDLFEITNLLKTNTEFKKVNKISNIKYNKNQGNDITNNNMNYPENRKNIGKKYIQSEFNNFKYNNNYSNSIFNNIKDYNYAKNKSNNNIIINFNKTISLNNHMNKNHSEKSINLTPINGGGIKYKNF